MRRFLPAASVATLLAAFVLLLFYRLLFTDRVLASGDILHYFYPYRDYAAAALRAGRIPLWNPYIFMGVPFLANPQAAVLYPLHWPLSWLPVTKQIYWSGAIHAWILGLGGYALLRRWGGGWAGAVTAGLVLAGSGFYGGLLGHINQMNGAAWLPWLVWAVEAKLQGAEGQGGKGAKLQVAGAQGGTGAQGQETAVAVQNPQYRISNPPRLPRATDYSLLVTFIALSLLAGHTQTAYINLFGVGVWLVARRLGMWGIGRWGIGKWKSRPPRPESLIRPLSALFFDLLALAAAVVLGAGLAAAQLLPTLELSGLGLRSGGLSYGDVTSFSLRPFLLHWTLLPSYGLRDLSVVFGTLGYTEFVAYVGLLGLLLALLGLWKERWGYVWLCGLLFAGLGLFLALGRWNPFSLLFYRFVPGFDLFRTPARWMMLYTFGVAILAGLGVEGIRHWASGIWPRRRHPIPNSHFLIPLLLFFELLLAARALPHAQPTAPQAVYDLRTAPAHLLTEPARALHPAAMGRFLSMSTITFDPGDMADWQRILRQSTPPQLSASAFAEFVVALKSQEILAPNLPLLWRIPAVDGFDGGVLPLQRYNTFLGLLIPPAQLVPDGRVREQIRQVPPARLLALMDARFVITDKVQDLWFEGVYYDRQMGAHLTPTSQTRLWLENPHNFTATAVGIIGFADDQLDQTNQPLAGVTARPPSGPPLPLPPLIAGGQPGAQFADGRLDSPLATAAGATIAYQDVENGRQEYLAWLPLPHPTRLDGLEIQLLPTAQTGLTVQAVTLIDERTDTFVPLLPSGRGNFRRVHSGDVKIYQRTDGSGRVQLFPAARPVASPEEAVALLAGDDLPPGLAVVEASPATVAGWGLPGDSAPSGQATPEAALTAYAPERVVVRANSPSPRLLVLKDAYYPGWQATVNGQPAPLVPANGLFRGVPLPAGENEIVFSYQPASWRLGLWISLVSAGLLFAFAWAVMYNQSRRPPIER